MRQPPRRFVRPLPMAMPLALALLWPAWLAAQAPEVKRDPFPAQAVGQVHTLRIIPETCAYLQGRFVADPAKPYLLGAARTAPRCQPRARLVDPAKAAPSTAGGWILNDELRVPNATCPKQVAVVRIWRKPAASAPLRPDAQGRPRIYLEDAKQQAAAGRLNALPQFAAVLTVEGGGCAAASPGR